MIKIGAESGTSTQTNITLRNLTVDAEAQDIRCLRVCPGSQLILADGATVRNGRAINQDETTGTNDWGGGIVVDNGAKLTMEDSSSITGCSAEWGGAVYLSGEMEINGGEISNNTAVGDIYEINGVNCSASAHGGAIMIRACRADYDTAYDAPAKLTMRGGTISGNEATSNVSAFGGAISIIGTPDTGNLTNTFVMSGGTISNNKAGYGGAISAYAADIYWQGNTSIQLSGNAKITDNIARNYGGAICLFGNNTQNYTDTLTMSGGMISGNKALAVVYSGDGAYIMSENEDLGFLMPEEGTNLWYDAMVMTRDCENTELAYEFMDFMLRDDVAYRNTQYVGYSSPVVAAYEQAQEEDYEGIEAYVPRVGYEKDEIFRYQDTDIKKLFAELWTKVKAQ